MTSKASNSAFLGPCWSPARNKGNMLMTSKDKNSTVLEDWSIFIGTSDCI